MKVSSPHERLNSGRGCTSFDIHGDTLEEVVAAFKAESEAGLVAPLMMEWSEHRDSAALSKQRVEAL